jgi:hypothetical protein
VAGGAAWWPPRLPAACLLPGWLPGWCWLTLRAQFGLVAACWWLTLRRGLVTGDPPAACHCHVRTTDVILSVPS